MPEHPKYSRFDLSPAASVAYARFSRHHTELNDLYWSFVPAYHFVRYSTKCSPATAQTAAALFLSGPDARRPPTFVGEWRHSIGEFTNWTRLGMALSAASYLEIYMREVIALALASDPFLVYGLPKQLDGVVLLKAGKVLSFETEVTACCRGQWPSRIANYRRLFGAVPGAWESVVSDLEQIRALRNAVGHAFGRDLRGQRALLRGLEIPAQRLSEERLKKWLSIIDITAAAIDAHLVATHIGAFEYFVLYHDRRANLRKGQLGKKDATSALSSLFSSEWNRRVPRSYCRSIIAHYDAC